MTSKIFIIFDFDGTLADTSRGIFNSFFSACTELQLDCPPIEHFRYRIGPPVEQLVLRIFPDLNHSQIRDFTTVFREHYDSYDYRIIQWYKGVDSALKFLNQDKKIPLGIVTNKPTTPTTKLVRERSLEAFFDFIVGVDYLSTKGLGPRFNSKTEAIQKAMDLVIDKPTKFIYVGDTLKDYEATRNLNIRFIAANYGFYNWTQESIPCQMISKIEELSSLFDGECYEN